MQAVDTQSLVTITEATRLLAEARTLDDVAQIHDLAAAALVYARQHKLGIEAQNHAGAICIEANMRRGEILRDMARSGERASVGGDRDSAKPAPSKPILKDLNTTKRESADAQVLAAEADTVRASTGSASPVSSYERTNWRDMELSSRHRQWGFNCPGVDLDFLMVEYNLGVPVALVEYKRCTAKAPDTTHPTYRALADLANNYGFDGLPFLIARYWPETWAFRVTPLNDRATEFYETRSGLDRSEREFVADLYEMRTITVDERVIRTRNTVRPPV